MASSSTIRIFFAGGIGVLAGSDRYPLTRTSGGFSPGQGDDEDGSLSWTAAHVDLAAQHGHQAADDVESQAGPRRAPDRGIIGAIELFKEAGHMFLADSDPLVCNLEPYRGLIA